MKINLILKTAMAVGFLAVSGASSALTVNTTFTGSVPNVCSLTAGAAGVVALDGTGKNIGTDYAGGSRGTVLVACTGTAHIEVVGPTTTGAAASSQFGANSCGGGAQLLSSGVEKANTGGMKANGMTSGTYQIATVCYVCNNGFNT